MKTSMLLSALIMAASLGSATHAQTMNLDALNKAAAGGPAFQYGSTEFRIVPGARIERTGGAQAKVQSQSKPASGTVLGQLGDFTLLLGGAAGPQARTAAAKAADKYSGFGVAVNSRSGAPVIVAPRVKVYLQDAAVANALAKRTGGKVRYASGVEGKALLDYPTVADAQAALGTLAHAQGVESAELDVIQTFQEHQ